MDCIWAFYLVCLASMEDILLRIFVQAPGFLLAIVIHEAAHAYVAYRNGDDTAKRYGRLTLNPMAHIDIVGTVVFPLVCALIGGVIFGWAKPVPINTGNFKKIRKSIFWVSFAGPGANLILALVSAFLLSLWIVSSTPDFYLFSPIKDILHHMVIINIILAVFNLIPFPPLDGSKMVSSFLSYEAVLKYESLGRYSFLFFIALMYTGALRYVINPAIKAGYMVIGLFYNLLM